MTTALALPVYFQPSGGPGFPQDKRGEGHPIMAQGIKIACIVAAAVASLQLWGCAASRAPLEGRAADQALAEFKAGKATLSCGLSCSGRWGWSRREAKMLYDTEQWIKLAELVTRIGHDEQLAWFYLGRAAEGLGRSDAARSYYLRAKFAQPCHVLFDNCNGLGFPAEADAGLARLEMVAAQPSVPAVASATGRDREAGSSSSQPRAPNLPVLPGRTRGAGSAEPTTPLALSEEQIKAVEDGIRARLKDPESARFSSRFTASRRAGDTGVTVCGKVNAKNSFGGYTGDAPFIGILFIDTAPPIFAPISIGGRGTERHAVLTMCMQAGVGD